MRTLTLEPLIDPALWIALAVIAAGVLVLYALSRPGQFPWRRWIAVVGLMAVGLALVLLILLNPTWVQPIPPPAGKPLLTLLVDSSASMSAADQNGGKETRFQAAAETAARLSGELGNEFDTRVRVFSTQPAPATVQELASIQPGGESTDIAAAIADNLNEEIPQGQALLLLSDGIHNTGSGWSDVLQATRLAKAMAAPIYTDCIGSDVKLTDLAVEFHASQEVGFVGQQVPVTVYLEQQGLGGATAEVVLLKDGVEVGRQSALLPSEGRAAVQFQVAQESTGLCRYEAKVAPFPGEVVVKNNSATFLLRVIDEPIHLLMLEGKPYWDTKFLMRTIASDPCIQLDSIVRLASGRFMRRTVKGGSSSGEASTTEPAAASGAEAGGATSRPTAATRQDEWAISTDPKEVLSDPEKLRAYQIVILGRDTEDFLTEQTLANLRNWLSRDGGSLLCSRGAPTAQIQQALSRLMPVRWSPVRESRFRVRLTDRGQSLRLLAGVAAESDVLPELPTLATVAQPDDLKPGAVVLATALSAGEQKQPPVLAYQPYGAGRVVVIEGGGMWRWAFLPPQYKELDPVYQALWQSLLRWLVSNAGLLPGQQFALRTDKITFDANEQATATLLVHEGAAQDQVPTVVLTGDDAGGARQIAPSPLGEEPGTFRANFGKLPEGRYEARIVQEGRESTASVVVFDVRKSLDERLNLKPRPDLMARVASETGGKVLTGSEAKTIVQGFREHLARSRPPRVSRTEAWDRWWCLGGVVIVWTLTWVLRRRGGLV